MAEEDQDEVWTHEDMGTMRLLLLTLIERCYLEAISRLPARDLRAALA
jgi:hypothetical protein